jgi:hypothetical protein
LKLSFARLAVGEAQKMLSVRPETINSLSAVNIAGGKSVVWPLGFSAAKGAAKNGQHRLSSEF